MVTVRDADGCADVTVVEVMEESGLTINAPKINASCGLANGSAGANVSGGTPPYSYAWSNGGTSVNIQNLAAGLYTVTVTDSTGCSDSKNVVVPEDGNIFSQILVTNSSCAGNDGMLDLSVSGGLAPYSYEIGRASCRERV